MAMSSPSAWPSTTGEPAPCSATFSCGVLNVWCVTTRTPSVSGRGPGSRPCSRNRSVVILNAVLAAGTPQ